MWRRKILIRGILWDFLGPFSLRWCGHWYKNMELVLIKWWIAWFYWKLWNFSRKNFAFLEKCGTIRPKCVLWVFLSLKVVNGLLFLRIEENRVLKRAMNIWEDCWGSTALDKIFVWFLFFVTKAGWGKNVKKIVEDSLTTFELEIGLFDCIFNRMKYSCWY